MIESTTAAALYAVAGGPDSTSAACESCPPRLTMGWAGRTAIGSPGRGTSLLDGLLMSGLGRLSLSVEHPTVRLMPTTLEVPVLTVEELEPALTEHFSIKVALTQGSPPAAPGAYVWETDRKILYIGSGCPLRKRLGDYERWLTGAKPDERWEVSVVYMLKVFNASRWWVTTDSDEDAKLLERRLIEWHRACTGVAPVVTGWEAKVDGPRWHAQEWARSLWNAPSSY